MKNYIFNYLTLIIIYFAFFFVIIKHFMTNSLVHWYTYIGLILMFISLVFFTMARIKLGNLFQLSAEANKLIKDGIYKVIRHPIYLFGFTFILGFFIFIQVFYGLIFLLILFILQMKRIKNEEKVLEKKFGDEYLVYKKSTWF
jgi:protein-S-isoprenylcysteine O-methyltransferase Ste14